MSNRKHLRALLIEDSADDADLLVRELRRNNYDVTYERVETEAALVQQLERQHWDVILSDYSLPVFSAPAALKVVQERKFDLPFIIVSGTVGEETAVASLKAGAHDFFTKGKLSLLAPAIEREMREAQERRNRRQIQEQLRQSEERFAKAFHASPVGITITSVEERYLDVNEYYLNLMGYRRVDVIGRTSDELGIWLDPQARYSVDELQYLSGSVRNVDAQIRTRTGDLRSVLASFELIELAGEPCVLTLIHDVTEQRRAQLELRALYNATSYLFQASSVSGLAQQIVQAVVHEFGQVECVLKLIDKATEEIATVAYAGERQPTEPSRRLDGDGPVLDAVRRASVVYVDDVRGYPKYEPANPQTRSELVVPLRTSSGVIGVLNLQSANQSAFSERDRRVIAAFAERASAAIESVQLYEQINAHAAELERRVAERTAELQRAKDRVEAIFHNSSEAIFLVRGDGRIEQANDSVALHFGKSSEELKGHLLNELFSPDQVEPLQRAMQAVVEHGHVFRLDVVGHGVDGHVFDAEIAIAPVPEDDGQSVGLICSVRDITDRKQAEQELRRSLEQEKEVNELKSRFVSMVSHEFRTPLATILSSSEAVKIYKDRMTEEKQMQHLDRIHSQVRRMVSLLDDVLLLSRAEAKGLPFTPVSLQLNEFCQDIVDDMQFIALKHTIQYRYEGDTHSAVLDRELIRQILTNLLSNAIKYSPSGSTITFDVVRSEQHALFQVRDEGIGIPPDDQARLFEAFHRAANSGTVQGTGLGLAIVKRAVDAHGGRITFESELGRGTMFIVTIPFATE